MVDSLEGFYQLSVEDVATRLRGEYDSLQGQLPPPTISQSLRADEFLSVYLEEQSYHRPEPLGEVPGDFLRASLVGRELAKLPSGGRRTVLIDGAPFGQDRLPRTVTTSRAEVKAALCYAHDLLLEDPFDEEQNLPGFVAESRQFLPHVSIEISPDPAWFVATVEAIADLAPLARAGVVSFISRRVGMDPRLHGLQGSNAWDVGGPREERAVAELAARTLRVWLSSGGSVVPMFASDAEEADFTRDLGLLSAAFRQADSMRLRRLTTLALPNADNLDLRRMLDIRHDDTFEVFRSRERQALALISDDTSAGLATFRQEMKAAAAQVSARSVGSKFVSSTRPRMIGWGIGSLAAGAIDWHAMVAVLATGAAAKAAELISSSLAQALADRGSSAQTLHHHYATLGAAPDP